MASTTENLQAEHPDWYLWRSGGGSWMATRRKVLGVDQIWPRFANTLMENTAEALADKLAEQKRLGGGAG